MLLVKNSLHTAIHEKPTIVVCEKLTTTTCQEQITMPLVKKLLLIRSPSIVDACQMLTTNVCQRSPFSYQKPTNIICKKPKTRTCSATYYQLECVFEITKPNIIVAF